MTVATFSPAAPDRSVLQPSCLRVAGPPDTRSTEKPNPRTSELTSDQKPFASSAAGHAEPWLRASSGRLAQPLASGHWLILNVVVLCSFSKSFFGQIRYV